MDAKLLGHLCTLSKLWLEESERNQMRKDMAGIIALMDTIRSVQSREAGAEGGETLDRLRADGAGPSTPAAVLLGGAPQSEAGCCAVPMMME